MSRPSSSIFFNTTTPAAPAAEQNIVFQSDGATPEQSITAYPQVATVSLLGVVRPDGSSITIAAGVLSAVGGTTGTTHSESLTDSNSNFIFAGGDIVTVVGVPN